MKRIVVFILLLFAIAPGAVFAQTPSTNPFEGSAGVQGGLKSWKEETIQSAGAAIYGNENANLQSSWKVGMDNSAYILTDWINGSMCSASTGDVSGCTSRSTNAYIGGVIASMYGNKPADFGLWIADSGRTLGFIPDTAYAQGQGVGFTGLTPLLPIWKAFRNIAYLLMTIVIIVIGFMVMFRKKIDPKTVVTAQNAIPRVIIALILITFSYAIVGILIDIMYIVLFFAIALFKSAGLQDPQSGLLNTIYGVETAQDLYGGSGLFINMWNIEINPWKLIFGIPGMPGDSGDGGLYLTTTILGIFATIAGFTTANPILGTAGGIALLMPLVHLIVAIATLFLFIRLLVFFITSYVQIIISLLLGPLQFLGEAFPGSNAFSSWLKNLVANLAVFPIGGAMFMLSGLFAQFSNESSLSIWRPPYTAIGGNNVSIAALLSLGILFAIPNVAGSIKEALKAKAAVPMLDFGGAGGAGAQWVSTLFYLKSMVPGQFWDTLSGRQGGDKKGGH